MNNYIDIKRGDCQMRLVACGDDLRMQYDGKELVLPFALIDKLNMSQNCKTPLEFKEFMQKKQATVLITSELTEPVGTI